MTEALVPIVAEITIDAPIEHVWEVLTSDATVPQWLGSADYRRIVGTTFQMSQDGQRVTGAGDEAIRCDLITLQPPHKFSFTWYVPGAPKTLVQISLFSEGAGRTYVRLVHEGWEQFPPEEVRPLYDRLAGAWRQSALPKLRNIAQPR